MSFFGVEFYNFFFEIMGNKFVLRNLDVFGRGYIFEGYFVFVGLFEFFFGNKFIDDLFDIVFDNGGIFFYFGNFGFSYDLVSFVYFF